MSYIGTVVLSLSHFIEKETVSFITPNELRHAAEELACQMEALEKEGWSKSGKIYWNKQVEVSRDKQFQLAVRYSRKFISKGHFLQELQLTENAGLNTNKGTIALMDIDGGEGVVWCNENKEDLDGLALYQR